MANSLNIIEPYRWYNTWMFDSQEHKLVKEPFLLSAGAMLDILTKDIPNAHDGFKLWFSASPFPGYQRVLQWVETSMGGNWYQFEDTMETGWLCPSLYHYFDEAPAKIYLMAEGIDDE